MYSVQFDSIELVNSTYYIQYARHQSAPERNLTLLALSNEDGSVLVAEKYGPKIITVKGHVSANTPALLQTQVDTMKELFAGKEKNLDILPDGGMTRRYVATCSSHTLTQDFYNTTFLPYEAKFIVPSGAGLDTALTEALDGVAVITNSYSSSFTLSGSYLRQNPIITIRWSQLATTAMGTRFKLTNGSEDSIVIIQQPDASRNLIINCNDKTVKFGTTGDEAEIGYFRQFPLFALGSNTFNILVGRIPAEVNESSIGGSSSSCYAALFVAQSFQVSDTDSTYQGLDVYLDKVGTLANDLTIEIQTDDSGKPSGTAVSNATFSIAKASVTTEAWYEVNSASMFSLTANVRYWLVFKTTAGDSSNRYSIFYAGSGLYRRGNAASSSDSGSTWTQSLTNDRAFRLYYGGIGDGDGNNNYTLDVDYTKKYL